MWTSSSKSTVVTPTTSNVGSVPETSVPSGPASAGVGFTSFAPIGDFLHAVVQSAMAFGRGSRQPSRADANQQSSGSRSRSRGGVSTVDTRQAHPAAADTLKYEHIELTSFGGRLWQRTSDVGADVTGAMPIAGLGHVFAPTEVVTPTWCDLCGDFIWGLYGGAHANNLTCHNCNYTCHDHCSTLVTLNCKDHSFEDSPSDDLFLVKHEETESLLFSALPSDMELAERIARYNATANGKYHMTMEEGSGGTSFHGWVRVHLNLSRPINVLAGTRPPSIYDIMHEPNSGGEEGGVGETELLSAERERTLTSFYLPRDTVKALHITCHTTARQMIAALLRKFKVVDHPHKFQLYEKHWLGDASSGKGILRIVQDHEKPLWLVLSWDEETVKNRKLVLQENDTGGIMWEAFTVPELSNFLRILDREEDEYLNQVRSRYSRMAEQLREAMDRFQQQPSPDATPCQPVEQHLATEWPHHHDDDDEDYSSTTLHRVNTEHLGQQRTS